MTNRSPNTRIELEILECQRDQHEHDLRNHFDILSLHKTDRLKHYGLHFAKYVGRLARDANEEKSREATLTDAFLVCLSAANTLHQKLEVRPIQKRLTVLDFASSTGMFCDACEKIDHLEDFVELAKESSQDIFDFVVQESKNCQFEVAGSAVKRRKELKARHFYIRN